MKRRASSSADECLHTLVTAAQRPRNYRFQEWYPYRLGNTTLNAIYPVRTENPTVQHCCAASQDLAGFQDLCTAVTVPLPEVVLRQIFSCLHPTAKVKCSAVCHQWNELISSSSTWRGAEIRVILLNDRSKLCAAKEFLSKIAKLVHKLCLHRRAEVPNDSLIELLPEKMDKLTVLDIGRLKGFTKNFIRKISNAMPNLEVLNMEGTVPVSIDCWYELFTDDAFPRLKELILAFVPLTDSVMAKLVVWNRPLKVLNIDGSFPLHDGWQVNVNNAQFTKTLERFYANGFTRENTVFNDVTNFRNLKLLSLTYCPEATDREFLTIKNLRQLEHLHLTGQCSWLRTASLLHLFTVLPEDPYGFPYRLKFLCLSHFYDLNDDVIELIIYSCPELEALNVSRSDSITKAGMRMIVEGLRHLRHLDVSHNRSFDKDIVAPIASTLPRLRFLVAHGCRNIDINDLRELTEQRKDIIISVGRSYILNWSLNEEREQDETIVVGILDQLRDIPGLCCMTDIMQPFL